ncbi:MAG TPA: Hsp20/alpha crystallin family protein [Pyrinomonadaceae bacterium]|jgi:HSP20 family protein
MTKGWDPLRDLVGLQDRMNRLFEDAAHRRHPGGDEEGEQEIERADWTPLADIYESEQEYTIALDLPGIDRAALEISLDEDRLMIRGVRPAEDGARRAERPHGRFLRRFGVPATVDRQAIGAEYKDGVLRVRLPRHKEQKSRRVQIKVS